MSQAGVAEQLNISQSTYNSWESDRTVPSPKYFARLAQVLGVEPSVLMPTNLTVQLSLPSQAQAHPLPVTFNAQLLYEDLTTSHKQVIGLQQLRIEQLEAENQQLRQQLSAFSQAPR